MKNMQYRKTMVRAIHGVAVYISASNTVNSFEYRTDIQKRERNGKDTQPAPNFRGRCVSTCQERKDTQPAQILQGPCVSTCQEDKDTQPAKILLEPCASTCQGNKDLAPANTYQWVYQITCIEVISRQILKIKILLLAIFSFRLLVLYINIKKP